MKTIIYTSFPCVVKYKNQQESLTQNENLVFEEEFDKIDVYPVQKGKISFEIIKEEKESAFYRIIEHDGKRLIFLIDGLYTENADVYEVEYQGVKSKIEIFPQRVVFCNKENKKIVHLNQKYKKYSYGNIKHINYCLLENVDDENTLLVYNVKKNTARVFNAKEIAKEDDGFVLKNSAFGYTSVTAQLYIDDEGLKVRKKDFIEAPGFQPLKETISYQFLNSVKIGDFSKALSLLDENLNDRLNSESLKVYFGDITYFYMLNPLTAYAISNGENVVYEFEVKNQKITEISSN